MRKSLKDEVKYLESKLHKNEDSFLFARLADAYLQMDRVDDAIELCEKGIKKHPYYVTGHYVLGKCYLKKKHFDQAEKELKRVLLFDPKYIAAHREYAELMAQIGWNNTSEMSYEEIIRIDPLNEHARRRLQELRSRASQTPETQGIEDETTRELEDVEKDFLSAAESPVAENLSPSSSAKAIEQEIENDFDSDLENDMERMMEKPAAIEPETATAPATPPEEADIAESVSPPIVKELFKEEEDVFEDDKANLDLLEDIFRDDELPDLTIDEDFDSQLEPDTMQRNEAASEAVDQRHLFGEEFQYEEAERPGQKEYNGLDDDEVFALMAEDEDFSKPMTQSPLDVKEPDFNKQREIRPEASIKEPTPETEPFFEPRVEKTLEELQQETRPRFEPPMESPPEAPQPEETPLKATEEPSLGGVKETPPKKEKIVTSTLGEIYAAQHQYAKAIGVYEILRKKDPTNELYRQKIEYLQKKLEESQSEE